LIWNPAQLWPGRSIAICIDRGSSTFLNEYTLERPQSWLYRTYVHKINEKINIH
jgi:hypothetical protein